MIISYGNKALQPKVNVAGLSHTDIDELSLLVQGSVHC